jgi:hypothetical protein
LRARHQVSKVGLTAFTARKRSVCGPRFAAAAISLTILLPPEKSRLRALLDHPSRLHRQGQTKHQAQGGCAGWDSTYLATILGRVNLDSEPLARSPTHRRRVPHPVRAECELLMTMALHVTSNTCRRERSTGRTGLWCRGVRHGAEPNLLRRQGRLDAVEGLSRLKSD